MRVDLQFAVRALDEELGHPVKLDQEVHVEGERHPAAPLPLLQRELRALHLEVHLAGVLRPVDGDGNVDVLAVLERGQARLFLLGEGAVLLLSAQGGLFLLEDRALGTAQIGLGDAAVEEQALQVTPELRAPFLEGREIGRGPSSRRCPRCRADRAGAGRPGVHRAHLLGREGHGNGQHLAPQPVPAGGDPEGGPSAGGDGPRPLDGDRAPQELGRLLLHHGEIGHVGVEVPDRKS